jgi:tetratricopeptide (TPR) repeat protein
MCEGTTPRFGRNTRIANWNEGQCAMRVINPALAAVVLILLTTEAEADERQDCAMSAPDHRINACTKILQSNPLDFSALFNRGISYNAIGQYDNALVDLNKAMHLNSNSAGLYLERGLAYEGRSDHERAITDFSEAIRRDDHLVVAHFGRAMAYEASGRGELAMVDLANGMRLDRNMVAALYMQRGYSLTQAAQHDRAIAAFTKSIEINPNWLLAYFGRGAAYLGKGDTQRSAADYRKCIEFTATTELEQRRQQAAREQLEKLSQ